MSDETIRRRANSSAQAGIQYVSELAGADDAWITVVDAARITGSSESMANRWVNAGRLPIRGDPEILEEKRVGIPARTRQCRVSDVAKLRPILYPEMAVSQIARTLDLPSLPKEMAQLSQQQHQLQEQLRQEVVDAGVQLRQEIDQLQKHVQEQLTLLQETLARSLAQSEQRFAGESAQLRATVTQLQTDVQAQEGRRQQDLQAQQETFRTQLGQLAATQQGALHTVQQRVETALAELKQDVDLRMETLERYLAEGNQIRATLLERLEQSWQRRFEDAHQADVRLADTLKAQEGILAQVEPLVKRLETLQNILVERAVIPAMPS